MVTEIDCSIPGCKRVARCRGWCRAHYARWCRHGDPRGGRTDERPHGLTKAEVVAWHSARSIRDGECLLSVAATANGYPSVGFAGKTVGLHRLSLEVRIDRALERDEHARHTCHRKTCINPEHLYAGIVRGDAWDV